MSLIETRYQQMFLVLDAAQIEVARRFASGDAQRFKPGEALFDVGQSHIPAWLALQGSIDITRRDGLNHEQAIVTLRAGQMIGEISQLAGRGTLAAGRAGPEGCTALPSTPRICARWLSAPPRSANCSCAPSSCAAWA